MEDGVVGEVGCEWCSLESGFRPGSDFPARPQVKSHIMFADFSRSQIKSPPKKQQQKNPLNHTLTQGLVVAF